MIYVVSGMARTGTSMMMHALIKGGIPAIYDVGRDDLRLKILKEQGYDGNHFGIFELYTSTLLKRFPDDLDRELVKISDTTWDILEGQAKDGIRVVYMLRDKENVLMSTMALKGKIDLDEYSERHDKQGERIEQVRNRPDVKSVDVFHYEDVVKDPEPYFELLKEHGFPIDVERAVSVVYPSLHHFRSKT
jgi:hypothetical protein